MSQLKQFVGFLLCNEHYGIDIMAVEEIISMTEVTPVPRTPSFVEGIINLRGVVIPIIDLCKKLAFTSNTDTSLKSKRIIITINKNKRIGFIVDRVEEVIRIEEANIDKAPGNTRVADNYISGLARTNKGMVILLDVSKIFSLQEQSALEKL